MTNLESDAYQSQKRLQLLYGVIFLFLGGMLLYVSQTQDILPTFSLIPVFLFLLAAVYKFFVGFRLKV